MDKVRLAFAVLQMKDLEELNMSLVLQSGLKQFNFLSFKEASNLCFVILILIMEMALI